MGIMKLFILLLAIVLAAESPVADNSEDYLRVIHVRRYHYPYHYRYYYRYHRYYYRYHRYYRYLAEKPVTKSSTELYRYRYSHYLYRYYRYYRYHRYRY